MNVGGIALLHKHMDGNLHSSPNVYFYFFVYLCVTVLCPFPGADHHPVHRLPGAHLLLLLCVPGGEGRGGRQRGHGVRQLRRRPVVGRGERLHPTSPPP